MHHGYEVEVAIEYGIEEAILINHFAFWINTNAANGENYISGKFWMYSTIKGLLNSIPELRTARVVNYTIDKLIKKGVLMSGHFTKSTDRTTWYTFTDKGLELVRKYNLGTVDFAILQKRKFDNTKSVNGIDENVNCISINTNNKDNKKEDNNINIVQTDLFGSPEEVEAAKKAAAKKKQEEEIAQIEEAKKLLDEEFNKLYDLYGRKQAKANAMKEWQRLSPEDRTAVLEKTPAWVENYNSKHTTREYQPLLSTFLHQRRWEDELENLILQTDVTTTKQQRSGSRITESAASNASINEAARQLSDLLGG